MNEWIAHLDGKRWEYYYSSDGKEYSIEIKVQIGVEYRVKVYDGHSNGLVNGITRPTLVEAKVSGLCMVEKLPPNN